MGRRPRDGVHHAAGFSRPGAGLGAAGPVERGAVADGGGERVNCLEMAHEVFLERCADGDMAVRFGRPDVFVSDLRRMGE